MEIYMKQAVDLAKQATGNTFSNPLVGAVIVHNNQIISEGYHKYFGGKHAEVNAIENCKDKALLSQSTLFVTLEPCSHYGKQPPCIEIILESNIKHVIIGQKDPNPQVAGKGIEVLQNNGVLVEVLDLEEVKQINRYYNFYYQNNRPFILLKQAISLNGQLSNQKNTRTQVTGQAVYDDVHQQRKYFNAILVGANTVIIDNPSLLPADNISKPPVRVVLDRQGLLKNQLNYTIFKDESAPVFIFSNQLNQEAFPKHVKVISVPNFNIETIINTLTQLKIQSIYVEGGASINSQFVEANLFDELITYIAPRLFSNNGLPVYDLKTDVELTFKELKAIGNDIKITSERRG